MNAHDAIAIQSLVARVADLDGLLWTSDDGDEVQLTPRFYVWRALAKGKVQAFAVDIHTGHPTAVSSEVFMGSTSFVYDLEAGILLFTDTFAPFGGRWVAPTLGDVRECYERWQFRHDLDEDWTPLRQWLEEHVKLDASSLNRCLDFPLYVLAVDEPEAAEQEVRNEQAVVLGRAPKDPVAAEPLPLEVRTLSSKQVAGALQIGEQSLRRWRSQGKGPPWVKLEGQKVVYFEEDVRAWMLERQLRP